MLEGLHGLGERGGRRITLVQVGLGVLGVLVGDVKGPSVFEDRRVWRYEDSWRLVAYLFDGNCDLYAGDGFCGGMPYLNSDVAGLW